MEVLEVLLKMVLHEGDHYEPEGAAVHPMME
jgi:hypothetical protein